MTCAQNPHTSACRLDFSLRLLLMYYSLHRCFLIDSYIFYANLYLMSSTEFVTVHSVTSNQNLKDGYNLKHNQRKYSRQLWMHCRETTYCHKTRFLITMRITGNALSGEEITEHS